MEGLGNGWKGRTVVTIRFQIQARLSGKWTMEQWADQNDPAD